MEVETQTKERKIIEDRIMALHCNGKKKLIINLIVVLSARTLLHALRTQWSFAPTPVPALLDLASIDVAAPPSVSGRGRTCMAGLACVHPLGFGRLGILVVRFFLVSAAFSLVCVIFYA